MGETLFLPLQCRKAVFNTCLTLEPGEFATYTVGDPSQIDRHNIEIMGLDIDPRYGRVALIRTQQSESLAPF